MRAGWVVLEEDGYGPQVVLCEACIEADGHLVEEWRDDEDDDWRCGCCGATSDHEED